MKANEQLKLDIVSRVHAGKISFQNALKILNKSESTLFRYLKKYQEVGGGFVIHKNSKNLLTNKTKIKDYKNRRFWQKIYYKSMEKAGLKLKSSYSSKSSLIKVVDYFIKNFYELTIFLKFEDLPIDNNCS